MQKQLTTGPVMPTMLQFAVPMILGDLLQQCYNIADTLIVGRFIGTGALAAVGSAFTLMTFLTSILLGLAMGSGTVFSIKYGQKDDAGLKEGILASFVLLAGVTAVLVFAVYAGFDGIIWFLRIPAEIDAMMRTYLRIVFVGLAATFLYNYFASLLRALGNSVVPLVFLAVSAGLNIVLDLWFVCGLGRGVAGAAEATVIAQYVSGVGIALYTWFGFPLLRAAWPCRGLSTALARWSWRRLRRRLKSMPLRTCRCRISAMRSRSSWRRTTVHRRKAASNRVCAARLPRRQGSAWRSALWCMGLPRR